MRIHDALNRLTTNDHDTLSKLATNDTTASIIPFFRPASP